MREWEERRGARRGEGEGEALKESIEGEGERLLMIDNRVGAGSQTSNLNVTCTYTLISLLSTPLHSSPLLSSSLLYFPLFLASI